MEYVVIAASVNCAKSEIGVDTIFCVIIEIRRSDAVDEELINLMQESSFQSWLQSTRSRKVINNAMSRMRFSESADEVLRREKLEMLADLQHFSLVVKKVLRRHFYATKRDPGASILD